MIYSCFLFIFNCILSLTVVQAKFSEINSNGFYAPIRASSLRIQKIKKKTQLFCFHPKMISWLKYSQHINDFILVFEICGGLNEGDLKIYIQIFKVSYLKMDEAQLRELIPPKQQNPLLKRKPLNLGNKFISLSKGEQVEFQNTLTQHSLTLLFFAAEWCNVSKSFVPLLKKFYQEVNLQEKKMEIIYVGLDKVKKDYEAFVKTMPWVGLPFADEKIAGLKEFYDIRAIPKLLLLDMKGEEVKGNNYREDVYSMKEDEAYDKWAQLRTTQEKAYFYQNQP